MMKQTRRFYLFLLTVWMVLVPISRIYAQDTEKEINLKAVFLYNFTKYVSWQNTGNNSNFVIGVFGKSQIINPLNQIAKSNTVEGKKIVVLNFLKPEDVTHCDILFVSKNATAPIFSVASQTGKGTLIVSEQPAGTASGAAFNFVLDEDKLRFEASLKAINFSGLKVSAQLLKLAILLD
jgi:hypothetical protein